MFPRLLLQPLDSKPKSLGNMGNERFSRFTTLFRNCEFFFFSQETFPHVKDNESMSQIIYYAFFEGDFSVTDFGVNIAKFMLICNFIYYHVIETKLEIKKKEIAKCSWQRKLNRQSQSQQRVFQFQRSLMSFVSRNLCREKKE